MGDLSSKNHVRQVLADCGLFAKKHFGQNFLTDGHVLSKIVAAADIQADDIVLEVGPGLGVLTQEMASLASHVYAVEIDQDMAQILTQTMPENVTVINEDVLKVNLAEKLPKTSPVKVVANLPYYITSAVIFAVLEADLPITSLVVMVQKEVAERFLAKPGTKAYGIPTLCVGFWGTTSLVANVPPNCFFPRPDVHSAVIKIDVAPRYDIDGQWFFPLVRAAFANRRKTLQNCLANASNLGLTKDQAASLIHSAGFDPNIRGETLSLDDFANLTKVYASNGFRNSKPPALSMFTP